MTHLMKSRKQLSGLSTAILLVLIAATIGCAVYINDYYHADPAAIAAFAPAEEIREYTLDNGTIICAPQQPRAGLVFYPGGKVEHTAYLPLMRACAAEGILCALEEMPFRLAVLDADAAATIPVQFPDTDRWYIGGHSLGGAMAAACVADHTDTFDGLILLGAYSTADLSATSLNVLSLYGSEDGVLDREKYEESRKNLPADYAEQVIDGGCHAYFGTYGQQEGDGDAAISPETQIALTAAAISAFLS